VPLLGLVLLFGVPWFDRSQERAPRRRPVAVGAFVLVLVVLVVLSALGAGGPTEIVSQPAGKASSVTATASAAPKQAPPATAPFTVGNAGHGGTLFVGFCQQCHGAQGKGTDAAPSLNPIDSSFVSRDPQSFAANIDSLIQEGSVDASGTVLMPAFGQTAAMTQPQIADVEAYVMSLNGVDRAAIQQPGMDPRTFFVLTAVVFGLAVAAGVFALARLRAS
jgi:mono/diheme cytochrome c family protein